MDICVNYNPIGYVKWMDDGGIARDNNSECTWKKLYLDIIKWKTENAFIVKYDAQGNAIPQVTEGYLSKDAD